MAKKFSINRRQFLKSAGLAVLGAASACATPTPAPTPEPKKRVLRIAHMTDFHVQPEGIARNESVRALRHAQDQSDPPEIIFNTGDSIMDALEANLDRAEAQWEVFNRILLDECKLPIVHVIGNHDVLGWGRSDSTLKPDDPAHGKELAIEKLGLTSRYYSFDRAGWHFVVLDSNHPPNAVSPQPYIGKLDDEQFDWFVQDVEAVSNTTPICVLSHIPLVAACEYFDGPNEDSGNWVVPPCWIHIDARRFRQFFLLHSNIRLCLSGHTHQHEALDYLGVRYLTNGAISGNWWDGVYMNFPPAYVLVNLYEDGSADSTFVPY